jgi:hypothetical protein
VTVTPVAGPDRTDVTLRGFSDCAVIDGHLIFTRYDGKADNVVARSTSRTYDYAREKYPFLVRLTVPATAAPGAAQVYAEPFCGPPEEYPPSAVRSFRIERSSLALRVSPQRPAGGDLLRVRAGTCDGARDLLTVRFRDGDRVVDRRVRVDSSGSAAASVRLAEAGGTLEVSLPRAADECRGSSYAGPVSVVVRSVGGAGSAPDPTGEATPSPSAPAAPATPSLGRPSSSTTPPPQAQAGSDRGGRGRPALVAGLLVLVAAGAGAAVLRGRLRRG